MKHVVLGIDIGGTGIKFGLVDKKGNILFDDKLITKDYRDCEKLVQELAALTIEKTHAFKVKLLGVGIGTPNGNYYNGTIDHAPNLPWKGIVPLIDYCKKYFKLPARLTNDAKAAALGEMYYGAAKKCKHFIFITLGTGLGSGIVVDGKIVYGFDSLAGELGHVIIVPDGRECPCGRKGCLEQYASATGIVKTYYELLRNMNVEQFRLQLGNMLDSEAIAEKAREGDEIANAAFENTGEILGLALSNSVNYTRPEKIFLFGGLAQAGDLLFAPTRKHFEKNLMPIYKNKIEILPSALDVGGAAILGAASLIWNDLK